jgi:hypothetical protein
VTPNEVELEFPKSIARNPDIGEFAKAGGNAVNEFVARDDIFDHLTRGKDAMPCNCPDLNSLVSESNCRDLTERDLVAA